MGDIHPLQIMVNYSPITTFYQGKLSVRAGRNATGLLLFVEGLLLTESSPFLKGDRGG